MKHVNTSWFRAVKWRIIGILGSICWLLQGWYVDAVVAGDHVSPSEQEVQTVVLNEDPSERPLLDDSGQPVIRIRLRGDFNHDGLEDLALSAYGVRSFGNAGGHFGVYLQRPQGHFVAIGEFFGHPDAVAIEFPIRRNPRIWLYLRGGGGMGKIGYHELTESGVSEFSGITIFPGDGGSLMGNAMYAAMMNNSDVELIVERSEMVDGHVVWKPDR